MAHPIGKTALAARLSARLGVPKAAAETLVEECVEELRRAFTGGEGVTLQGFGSFKLVARAARSGTGPGGAPYSVPAHTAITFHPAEALAEAVAGLDLAD